MKPTPTNPGLIENLEKLIGGPRDGALLRYSLGNEWLKAGDAIKAAEYLRNSLEHDPKHSASWKLLGRALSASGDDASAFDAFAAGIQAAEANGDVQAAKEMRVFQKRLRRETPGG